MIMSLLACKACYCNDGEKMRVRERVTREKDMNEIERVGQRKGMEKDK